MNDQNKTVRDVGFNQRKYSIKSVNRKYLNLIVKKLKPKFNIKIINYFSCSPHNGCRPRKMRRV